MYFVYILKCADKTLYTGITTDLKRRVMEHNNSKLAAKYTASRRPVRMVYHEKLKSRSSALKREAEIKRWSRDKKIKLINNKLVRKI